MSVAASGPPAERLPLAPRARSPWRALLGLARFLLAALLVGWALSRPGAREALAALLERPLVLLVLPCFGLAGVALEAWRLALLVRAQGTALAWREALRVVALGSFVNHALSGAAAGDLARLLALARSRPRARVEVATALLVDRVIALGSLLALVLALVLAQAELVAQSELARGLAYVLALTTAVLAVALLLALSRRVHARLAPRGERGWREALARVSRALLAYRGRAPALAAALGVSLLGHGLLFALIVLEGALVAPDLPAPRVLALTLLALVVNALPVTPGGLGVGEAASEALFASAGATGGPAILLGWRAAQLPVVLLGAVLAAASGARERGSTPDPARR